jgi:bacterioferritin-associated ferredoxin
MINERTCHICRRIWAGAGSFLHCTIFRHTAISAEEETIAAEATSGEAEVTAIVVAAAINAGRPGKTCGSLICRKSVFWIHSSLHQGSVWNHLKRRFFLLHPVPILNIDGPASPKGCSAFMIVCSCNVLSDHDVRTAVSTAENLPRNARQVYGCLGCSVECGRCASTVKTIIDEALGACAKACRPGCPHSSTGTDAHLHGEFSLAAS